jgi:hypothetical protein
MSRFLLLEELTIVTERPACPTMFPLSWTGLGLRVIPTEGIPGGSRIALDNFVLLQALFDLTRLFQGLG